MAQPTTTDRRSTPPRQNTRRQERPEKGRREKEAAPSRNWSLPFERVRADERTNLTVGVLLMLLAVGLMVAFVSYLFSGPADQSLIGTDESVKEAGKDVQNWVGLLGAHIAYVFMFRWFGLGAMCLPIIVFLAGLKLTSGREPLPLARTTQFLLFLAVWTSLLLGYVVLATDAVSAGSVWCGGIGYEINRLLYSLLGFGSIVLIGFLGFAFIVFFFNVTQLSLGQRTQPVGAEAATERRGYGDANDTYEEAGNVPSDTLTDDDAQPNVPEPSYVTPSPIAPVDVPPPYTPSLPLTVNTYDAELDVSTPLDTQSSRPKTAADLAGLVLTVEDGTPLADTEQPNPVPPVQTPGFEPDMYDAGDLVAQHGLYDPTLDLPQYQYPTVDLLTNYPENQKAQVSADELEANKDRIVDTLGKFNIGIQRIHATIGPTVTLYEIVPADGVRISKIKSLEDDIALNLAALGIRIIAPMPGKGTIGIEVPNKNREMVSMRSMIVSEKFQKANMDLPVVLGKTISNEILAVDLAKMPHLLMAGATGQGKSVGLNVLLTSLLYKKHPAQLKFVLVDPKKVELTLFNKIERHFLAKLPDAEEAIITDTKKVVNTLNSLCIEMDNRYDLLKDAGVRNIKEYNAKFTNRKLNPERGHRYLPYIVLIIDELADLMMTAGKEVEQPIARLAQLARAIGIHLVVATQRPSVNVITGLIKANFPARLSFKVTSKIDSRTILDAGGAEQLVGMGDMLLSSNSDIIRLQCPFVDTNEIEEICEFVGAQRGYDDAYVLPEFYGDEATTQAEDKDVDLTNRDPMFDEAARLIVTHQQGSTSLIQRRLKLGYNRAGRLIDQLEKAGIVGPFEGSKARDVLVHDAAHLEEVLKSLG
ncbi:cell division FtsK/SpoIIIE [Fibrella aestuarina BUZ 2]|uniref:Cell division FtsK/SpoIIIE n=1 Tax=Fibrella aestuarina BUZ 2 TaxID=1166018 RepID=I0K2H9_9BACT|nr:DNA translocase FtsK [Fibrella aestuarina]CCG98332.1 cell division FtsK/SpoIIIE [Fibrella aestuarina BUZ 2]